MKKSVSLKLIVFSFLLVAASIAYSAPTIGSGTGDGSIVAGIGNIAEKKIVLLLDTIMKLVESGVILLVVNIKLLVKLLVLLV